MQTPNGCPLQAFGLTLNGRHIGTEDLVGIHIVRNAVEIGILEGCAKGAGRTLHGIGHAVTVAVTNESLPTRQPLIWALRGDYNVRYGMRLAHQGQEVPVNLTVVNQRYYGQNVSMEGDGWGEDWLGLIYEGIIYNCKLSSAELQRVQSYLAIKYGVTLRPVDSDPAIVEGDYMAADGLTKVWDYSANRAYHNNVAGIGRDDATALHQKQSRAVNSDFQPVIGLGTIAANNATNPNPFATDKSYQVWGNDNGSTAFSTPYSPNSFPPSAAYSRMGRVWKVQETGQVNTVSIQGPTIADLLLVSNDPTFTSGVTEIALEQGQGVYDFNSGQYFTFGVANRLTAGIYRLAVAHSMKCLAISGSFNGANVEQESCAFSAKEQQWQLETVGSDIYKLRNLNTGKIMEVDGGSTSNGRNVEQNEDRNAAYQQWRFILQEDGTYQMVAVHSNKCAGITYGSLSNGANLEQGDCTTTANYRMLVLPLRTAPAGLYTLTALHSGQCVEVAGAGLTVGVTLQQGDESGGNYQQWRLISQGDGTYQLAAGHSNKCVEVTDEGGTDGGTLRQATCSTALYQRFRLFPAALAVQSHYRLQAIHSDQCLTVAGATLSNGSKVETATCNLTATAQLWRLAALGNSYYKLINRNSNRLLEVASGSSATGAALQQWDDNDGGHQQWKLTPQVDGSYLLAALHSGQCIDAGAAMRTPGAPVTQAPCTTVIEQRFILTPVGEPTLVDFETNTLSIFTNGNGSTLTSAAQSGQHAASAPTTGATIAHRELISPTTTRFLMHWKISSKARPSHDRNCACTRHKLLAILIALW